MTIHIPYLIQSGIIKKPVHFYRLCSIYNSVNLNLHEPSYDSELTIDYSAYNCALQYIEDNKDKLRKYIAIDIQENNTPLIIYHCLSDEELERYKEYLRLLRASEIKPIKEIGFIKDSNKRSDFWWDLGNSVFFSFNEKYMQRFPTYLDTSLKYLKRLKAIR